MWVALQLTLAAPSSFRSTSVLESSSSRLPFPNEGNSACKIPLPCLALFVIQKNLNEFPNSTWLSGHCDRWPTRDTSRLWRDLHLSQLRDKIAREKVTCICCNSITYCTYINNERIDGLETLHLLLHIWSISILII